MPSYTSIGPRVLNSAGHKRSRSGSSSTDGRIKKLKSKFSLSSQPSALEAESSATGSTVSSGTLRPNAPPKENNPGTGRMVPNSMQVNAPIQQSVYQHHMHTPEGIPGATHLNGNCVYVFPHANMNISEDYHSRYLVVMDIFQKNLEEFDHMALKHPAKTDYKMRMCGTSLEKARPSILIYHPQADKSMGQRILRHLHRPQVRNQYNSSKMTVSFEIYWFSGPDWKFLGRPIDGLNIRMQSSYIPGALLLDDDYDRISTITCGIRFPNVDDAIFFLSTAHAFEEDDSSENYAEDEETVSSTSFEPNGGEDENGEIYRFGDVEYDMAEIRDYYEKDKENQVPQVIQQQRDLPQHVQGLSNGLGRNSGNTAPISPNRVWGRSREPEWDSSLNLDWALIKFKKSEQWKMKRPRLALHDIPGTGYQERPVAVITSRGSLFGTISSIPSFIANSNKISSLCKVWTVSLEDASEISIGDSGALVIDCLTSKAYGYIIGINHFEELYVIPLRSVLEQIAQMIPASYGSPEIFMALVPRRAPRPLPKTGKISGLTKCLYRYWPRKELNNMNTSFYEAPLPGDDSYDTDSSSSSNHYVDCPTSPMPNYPSEEETQHSSVPTSFGPYDEVTQSPATQFTSFQMLNDSMDEKIHNLNYPGSSFDDDGPPSSYETAKDGSISAPASPK